MRKNQEGAVLVYVLVMISVLTAFALGASALAANNLKNQRAQVARVQEQLKAEGEREKTAYYDLRINGIRNYSVNWTSTSTETTIKGAIQKYVEKYLEDTGWDVYFTINSDVDMVIKRGDTDYSSSSYDDIRDSASDTSNEDEWKCNYQIIYKVDDNEEKFNVDASFTVDATESDSVKIQMQNMTVSPASEETGEEADP